MCLTCVGGLRGAGRPAGWSVGYGEGGAAPPSRSCAADKHNRGGMYHAMVCVLMTWPLCQCVCGLWCRSAAARQSPLRTRSRWTSAVWPAGTTHTHRARHTHTHTDTHRVKGTCVWRTWACREQRTRRPRDASVRQDTAQGPGRPAAATAPRVCMIRVCACGYDTRVRVRVAHTHRYMLELLKADLKPLDIMTARAYENAMVRASLGYQLITPCRTPY